MRGEAGERGDLLRAAERVHVFREHLVGHDAAAAHQRHCVRIVHDVRILQREAKIADHRSLLPRLRSAEQQVPTSRASVAELQKAASTRKITLQGSSDAIASANLQSRIEELAASAGVMIATSEAVPVETRDPYRRIGLRLAVNGEYEAIIKLLGNIETATPPLVLGNLRIHGVLRPGR